LKYDARLYWEDAREGDLLPVFRMATSFRQAVMHVGAGRDYMLDHYDSEHVRANGHPSVYFNTLFHQSLVDHTIFGWTGPQCFLARRKIVMRGPIYAGDEVQGLARVTRVYKDQGGRNRVDLSVTLSTARGVCCESDASIELPTRASSSASVPFPSTETLSDILSVGLRGSANSPAIITDAGTTTFGELQRRSMALADALQAYGFVRGDRLAILMSSGGHILEALFAAAHLGVIVVPLNIRLNTDDIHFVLSDSQPRLFLVSQHFEELAAGALSVVPMVTVDENSTASLANAFAPDLPKSIHTNEPAGAAAGDDPLLILYTSGTTGRSKGCVLTHRNLTASTESMRAYRNPAPSSLSD
jgi:hypothetical protein